MCGSAPCSKYRLFSGKCRPCSAVWTSSRSAATILIPVPFLPAIAAIRSWSIATTCCRLRCSASSRELVDRCRVAGVSLSVCGEIASKPLEAMVLLGLGVRNLSMTPSDVGPVKGDAALAPLRPFIDLSSPAPGFTGSQPACKVAQLCARSWGSTAYLSDADHRCRRLERRKRVEGILDYRVLVIMIACGLRAAPNVCSVVVEPVDRIGLLRRELLTL